MDLNLSTLSRSFIPTPSARGTQNMAPTLPLELLKDFARTLKRMGLEATLLELLLTNKTIYSLCEPDFLRTIELIPKNGGWKRWIALPDGGERLRSVRKLVFKRSSFRPNDEAAEWNMLNELIRQCGRID
jgi:hypothetical protein